MTITGTNNSAMIVQIDRNRVVIRSPRLLKIKMFESLDTVGRGDYADELNVKHEGQGMIVLLYPDETRSTQL
jgi:hypothetical protein